MFGLRFAIQLPLYLAGAVTALGLINVPLGLPLFAFTCWLSYLVIKRVPTARTPEEMAAEQAELEADPVEATATEDDAR